ncbi:MULTISPECIES: metallophosphoesterase family protein [Clostridium]|uniref:Phosphoesterase n=1 Tax=Clostridium botulinum TaxID=1491 RepID=A0A6B4HUW7_CLOBO|nr:MULTISPECIES: metallophosphoesterase family protein [Clostridium]ACD52577.1 Ser/Thr protein phosphatase family protein [Clostridium botulinum E3 str. Alaska E43]AJF28249.1 serine/threonine protein phosphatase [Clostridium botulinum]AJF31309.1 serine/threonine protein phosphatase [Clostridium botulinum]KIL08460.1 serine/threonine protein phosphatase [Clostridium botulinum]MBN1034060.1 metallophosphoesterase [Clostridium botulinum]
MKIAIISDIHGNIYSLIRALQDIDNEKVDSIICLGDLVGYGPHPNEVIAMIKRRNILCIQGNYDKSVIDNDYTFIRETEINSFSLPWTYNELRAQNRYFLSNLPSSISLNIQGKKIIFVHGSPSILNQYLFENAEDTKNIIENMEEDILVCAHTHIPSIKNFDEKMYINCGSIGKPKIGRPNLTYCLLDINELSGVKAQIKELEYEYPRIVKDMTLLNFPSKLIKSFEKGLE